MLSQHKKLQYVEFFLLEHFINELEGRSEKKNKPINSLWKSSAVAFIVLQNQPARISAGTAPIPPPTGMQKSEHKVQSQQEENSIQCYTREYIRYSFFFFRLTTAHSFKKKDGKGDVFQRRIHRFSAFKQAFLFCWSKSMQVHIQLPYESNLKC